jgi:hypothetical protein
MGRSVADWYPSQPPGPASPPPSDRLLRHVSPPRVLLLRLGLGFSLGARGFRGFGLGKHPCLLLRQPLERSLRFATSSPVSASTLMYLMRWPVF